MPRKKIGRYPVKCKDDKCSYMLQSPLDGSAHYKKFPSHMSVQALSNIKSREKKRAQWRKYASNAYSKKKTLQAMNGLPIKQIRIKKQVIVSAPIWKFCPNCGTGINPH